MSRWSEDGGNLLVSPSTSNRAMSCLCGRGGAWLGFALEEEGEEEEEEYRPICLGMTHAGV